MAYDNKIADRIRERLAHLPNIEETEMMGGLTFMYNDKMCFGIIKDELMCRIDPDFMTRQLKKTAAGPWTLPIGQ
ncbi:MAG: TfoX/Sxy family protein [Ginsengibacter sp.]